MAAYGVTVLIVYLSTVIVSQLFMMAPMYSYSKEQFMSLRPESRPSLPNTTFRHIKQLGICATVPTRRGCRGGKPRQQAVDNSQKLNLSLWNSQSVGNKTHDLCDYVTEHQIHILCLTETWLCSEEQTIIGELSPPGYSYINVPQTASGRGGIGLLYHNQLNLKLVDINLPK